MNAKSIGKEKAFGSESSPMTKKSGSDSATEPVPRPQTRDHIIMPDYQEKKTAKKYKYKLQVIAADLTDRKLLVLPGDLEELGYNPDT
ncbi:MAG: hypothetical protein JRF50_10440, partial [Deltaproteobacteria bacterium]|nr:hypothetical protein [Deltaproteobacteria bacterium]